MHPELTHMINVQRNREMQDQAAAWRRTGKTRGAARARPAKIHFAGLARLARTAQSVPGLKPLQRPAATMASRSR